MAVDRGGCVYIIIGSPAPILIAVCTRYLQFTVYYSHKQVIIDLDTHMEVHVCISTLYLEYIRFVW